MFSVVEGPASLTGSSTGLGTVCRGRADEVGETSPGGARACCDGFGERADRVGLCAK